MISGTWSVACLMLALGTAPGVPADVVPLNHLKFEIPIRIDPARKGEIRSLELYYSTNQGRTWEQAGAATPEQTAFSFTAPTDGVYWFSVVVIDQRGNKEPPDPSKAPVGQKILIDTLKPELRLTDGGRQGETATVRWEVREEHLDLSKFKLEYRPADGTAPWAPVAATPAVSGQAAVRSAAPVVVRLSAEDAAGNTAESELKLAGGVVTASAAAPVDPPSLPPPSGGVAPPPPVPEVEPKSIVTVPPAPAPDVKAPIADAKAPGALPALPGAGPDKPAPGAEDLAPPPPSAGGPGKVVAVSPDAGKPAASSPTQAPTPAPAAGSIPSWNSGRPVGQVTNNRRVTLEYKVAKIGPSRVGSVELHVTRDDGLTWQRLAGEHGVPGDGRDKELRRTISVDLPDDGVYGFHLVVKSGAGLSKPPPRTGDAPQMRLELDTKLPTAELYRPELNPAAADSLLISWKASDKNLTENPIRLQWAERPTGPWEDIGGPGLPNSGSHSWRVGANVPPKVYLRLSVRDTAGNVAVAETPEPILVDLSTPEVESLRLLGGQ